MTTCLHLIGQLLAGSYAVWVSFFAIMHSFANKRRSYWVKWAAEWINYFLGCCNNTETVITWNRSEIWKPCDFIQFCETVNLSSPFTTSVINRHQINPWAVFRPIIWRSFFTQHHISVFPSCPRKCDRRCHRSQFTTQFSLIVSFLL